MATHKMQMIRSERSLFSSSDDSVVMKQIQETHAHDGRNVDVRPLLLIVEDIFQRATPTLVEVPQAHLEFVDDKVQDGGIQGMLEVLAYTINRISCEMICKCTGGGDAHATTVAVFHILSNYSWDSKLVLALAAFAMSYGEFWLTVQLHTINPLAKSVALLKQIPDILENTEMLKPRFEAINGLLKAVLQLAKCIVEFRELPSDYISSDTSAMATAMSHIPTAVYWTIRSVVSCSSQIIGLTGMGREFETSTTENWELSSLAHKINTIHGVLQRLLNQCHHHIDEKKHNEAYQTLVRLFEAIHIDNMKILKALIYSKDDLPLYEGSTKRKVSVDVLRRKIVVLFISDLDISQEELFILIQLYNEAINQRIERPYEIVWLPILNYPHDWTDAKQQSFNGLIESMPWYSVHHPSIIEPAVAKYIKDAWHFENKPLLVVLDQQGKVVCPNAIHMMLIWGSVAFPFSTAREEALWKEETWKLELLVDEIDPLINESARQGKFVCLYGGEDINWIRKFTTAMKHVIEEARLPLEMFYVGKSNPKERVRKVVTTITEEKLSQCWQDLAIIWFFWVRLESMWHSKMQHGKTVANDVIMQEVMSMLSFDGSDQGWAVIFRGSIDMVKAHGGKILDCLDKFETWKVHVEKEGFLQALTNALAPYQTHEHCTRLILPGNTGKIDHVVCVECKRPMEKYILYRCCTD